MNTLLTFKPCLLAWVRGSMLALCTNGHGFKFESRLSSRGCFIISSFISPHQYNGPISPVMLKGMLNTIHSLIHSHMNIFHMNIPDQFIGCMLKCIFSCLTLLGRKKVRGIEILFVQYIHRCSFPDAQWYSNHLPISKLCVHQESIFYV